jgi:hypothetical protein
VPRFASARSGERGVARATLRRSVRATAFVAVVATLALPSLAWAEAAPSPVPPIRVRYEAVNGCPASGQFVGKLGARRPGLTVASADQEAPALVVRITSVAPGSSFHGELVLRYLDGTEASRSVDGESCESVLDALALMSAMALDAEKGSPAQPAIASPPVSSSPPLAVDGASPAAAAFDLEPRMHLAAGVGLAAAFEAAPVVVPASSGFVEVSRPDEAGWSPTLRLAYEHAATGAVAVPGGGLQLVRNLGVIEGCPVRPAVGPFRLLPCLRVEGGNVAVSPSGLAVTHDASRPWFAAGVTGTVRYVPFWRVFVDVTGGLALPFVRDRFYFEQSGTVFRAPAVGGSLGGAVGFTIL